MPPGLRPTLGVFQAALELTSQCELHPDLVSQTFGYLFFFSNASLLNSLMERGEGRTGEGAGKKADTLTGRVGGGYLFVNECTGGHE